MRERSIWTFTACAVLLAIPGLIGVLRLDHLALHMAVNRFHAPWADVLFPYLTEMANGWVPTALAVLLLWKSWRSFLMVGLSAGLSAIVVQSLKHLLFADIDRPGMFLDRMPGLHIVAGMDLYHHFSFPSGHSTAAFSMCAALAVVIGRSKPAALLAVLAALLAFTRVYLSQHFTEDALAGAFVGTVVAVGVYFLLYRTAWGKRTTLDRAPFNSPFK
ncbi:MAG: phosphatase PAP2 family protein [Flavobacteriales bacterium]|nr:phosphatase PAP2 family protein [Flavobacteriales bacterium]MBK9597091.1 phosphatase PAP2 family protein [Flavobacteriales bacterium]